MTVKIEGAGAAAVNILESIFYICILQNLVGQNRVLRAKVYFITKYLNLKWEMYIYPYTKLKTTDIY